MNINTEKVGGFILRLFIIIGVVLILVAMHTAYWVDQSAKALHYNHMLQTCYKMPGAVLKFEADTPVFGSGIKMSCEYINRDPRMM